VFSVFGRVVLFFCIIIVVRRHSASERFAGIEIRAEIKGCYASLKVLKASSIEWLSGSSDDTD